MIAVANHPTQWLGSKATRQRLVEAMLQFVKGTRLQPDYNEHVLLEKFVQGQVSIDQVVELLTLKQES